MSYPSSATREQALRNVEAVLCRELARQRGGTWVPSPGNVLGDLSRDRPDTTQSTNEDEES